MGKNKKKKQPASSLSLGFFFVLLFLFLLSVSLIIKIILIAKNSRFDGLNRLTFAVEEKSRVKVLSFSPGNKTISILSLDRPIQENFSTYLRYPLESNIKDESLDISKENLTMSLFKILAKHKNNNSKITSIDFIRLILFSNSVPSTSYLERSLASNTSDPDKDYIASFLLTDTGLNKEKKKIQVTNASGISGIGNDIANQISNLGGDVILVRTADKNEKKSKLIHRGKPGYTEEKLHRIFNIPIEVNKTNNLADVIILIGEDWTHK